MKLDILNLLIKKANLMRIEIKLATKRDLEDLKKDLTIRMGTMFAVSVSILSILLTVLSKVH